jgi:D-arabinose 5-phosphate isomerase GutQ
VRSLKKHVAEDWERTDWTDMWRTGKVDRVKGPTLIGICCCGDPVLVGNGKGGLVAQAFAVVIFGLGSSI